MDIKAIDYKILPAVSAQKPTVPDHPGRGFFYASSASAADEIIDCVEIQSHNYRPTYAKSSPYSMIVERPLPNKGGLIDIWI
jgi:hypothetical protein